MKISKVEIRNFRLLKDVRLDLEDDLSLVIGKNNCGKTSLLCNDAVNAQRYLGRTVWRRWSGYHHRSRVETKMHCMKLLGQSLMARDLERQVAAIQLRVAVLNRYRALGIAVTELVG